jgi:hypothetical protein
LSFRAKRGISLAFNSNWKRDSSAKIRPRNDKIPPFPAPFRREKRRIKRRRRSFEVLAARTGVRTEIRIRTIYKMFHVEHFCSAPRNVSPHFSQVFGQTRLSLCLKKRSPSAPPVFLCALCVEILGVRPTQTQRTQRTASRTHRETEEPRRNAPRSTRFCPLLRDAGEKCGLGVLEEKESQTAPSDGESVSSLAQASRERACPCASCPLPSHRGRNYSSSIGRQRGRRQRRGVRTRPGYDIHAAGPSFGSESFR